MSIRISSSRRGTTIRAKGKDAQTLFDLMCAMAGEPKRPVVEHAEANKDANEFTRDGIAAQRGEATCKDHLQVGAESGEAES